MTKEEMESRTKAYANRVVRTLGTQLLRSGTSVGANYRAVCRAKSTSDFINKLRIVEEECDESSFWMELLVENGLIKESRIRDLMQEANQILSIVVASAKTARTTKPTRSVAPRDGMYPVNRVNRKSKCQIQPKS